MAGGGSHVEPGPAATDEPRVPLDESRARVHASTPVEAWASRGETRACAGRRRTVGGEASDRLEAMLDDARRERRAARWRVTSTPLATATCTRARRRIKGSATLSGVGSGALGFQLK